MHPRSPYQLTPNFSLLAQDYPNLQPYLTGNILDFQDDDAQRALTQALLHRDFNLTIDLPSDRLCPPVPNRLNYVLWIQDIVRAHEEVVREFIGNESGISVHGIDIGTGASAIYPLLACSLEPRWQFVASELDSESYTYACANVRRNKLEDRVWVVKVGDEKAWMDHLDMGGVMEDGTPPYIVHDMDRNEDEDEKMELGTPNDAPNGHDEPRRTLSFGFEKLFRQHIGADDSIVQPTDTWRGKDTKLQGRDAQPRIEFTMCNPPFYGSAAEVEESLTMKEAGPLGVCTGAPVEMITPGGEAQFVGQMVKESAGGGALFTWDANSPDMLPLHHLFHAPTGENDQPRTALTSPRKRALEKPAPKERSGKRRRVAEPVPVSGGVGEGAVAARWYTSMLGKMGSVVEVVRELGACGISNYAVTEFVQGQTRRWAVGWSLGGFRLPDSITRIQNPNPTLQRLMPARNTLRFPHLKLHPTELEPLRAVLSSIDGVRVVGDYIQGNGDPIDPNPDLDPNSGSARRTPCLLVRAAGDTWSRGARRKRKMQARPESGSGAAVPELEPECVNAHAYNTHPTTPAHARAPAPALAPSSTSNLNLASTAASASGSDVGGDITSAALVCSITWVEGEGGGLDVRWVYGFNRALFESFASHVVSRLGAGRG